MLRDVTPLSLGRHWADRQVNTGVMFRARLDRPTHFLLGHGVTKYHTPLNQRQRCVVGWPQWQVSRGIGSRAAIVLLSPAKARSPLELQLDTSNVPHQS